MMDMMTKCAGTETAEIEPVLYDEIRAKLQEKYGRNPDRTIVRRLEEEWFAIQRCRMAPMIAALHEVAIWLKENRHLYWVSGSAGSSFIFYLLGITVGNPLPPHHYCPECHSIHWKAEAADGFDLPWDATCSHDGARLLPDGHDLPWQTLWGETEEPPHLEVQLPKYLRNALEPLLEQCRLREPEYTDRNGADMICFPSVDFMFNLDTQYVNPEFHNVEIDELGYEFSLLNWESFAELPDDDEFICEPNSFADVLYIAGLVQSSGVWDIDTDYMIDQLDYYPSDMIAFQDDIFHYLIRHGFLEKDAQRGMNRVCVGERLPVITDEMRSADDSWVLSRCEKTKHLLPKSRVVESILFQLKSYL